MSFIPKDVILIWPSTNASIPAGWTRETALDGLYPKTAPVGSNPNSTGGAASHTHNAAANHGHSMNSHTHTVTLYQIGGDGNDSDSGGTELTAGHYHQPAISGVNGGALSSVSAVYDTVSNDPPYYTVIFVKPTAGQTIPNGMCALWYEATPPTGFTICDGSGGTPDLRNKYIKGAAGGADAGSTGGSTQNVHALTHTHSESSHYHYQYIYESGNVPGGGRRGQSGSNLAGLSHGHYVYLNANTAGSIGAASLTTSETVEPAYHKLVVIKNTAGASRPAVRGLIGLWLGTLASIPAGWRLCDGNNGTPDLRDKYLKVINTTGEIGNTGGSNTHTHGAQNHSHTGGSHAHTYNSGSSNLRHDIAGFSNGVGGGWEKLNKDHAHDNIHSIQNGTAGWGDASTSANSSSNEPQYRTVAPIMFKFSPTAGMLLAFL